MKSNLYLFLILVFSSLLFIPDAHAANYKVKKGDSLNSISKKFKVPVSDIMQQNNLTSNKLAVGTKLSIPEADKTSIKKISTRNRNVARVPNNSSTTVSDPFEVRYHQVKKGETIVKIAKKYSLSAERIMEINGLTTKKLKQGQQLLIKAPKPDTHIVKKGDSLWNISIKYNLSPEELRDINGLEDNSLKLGQKLSLVRKNQSPEEGAQSAANSLPSFNSKLSSEAASQKIEEIKILSKSEELSELGIRERLIIFAKKMLHLPYRFGGSSPFGIDCSAYVQKVYGYIGLALPRSAREQFRFGEVIDKDELSIGDLVFFRTYASFPSHVGIYLGNNLFIHASSKSKRVTIDSLDTPYYIQRFIGAKRVLSEDEVLKVEIPERIIN